MEKGNKMLSCAEARQMDLVDYLSQLGHEPQKIRSADYWYHSPLRTEKTPSFKVNRKLNLWFDHGLGKGGNLVDFGILYYNCTIKEFLQLLKSNFSFHPQSHFSEAAKEEKQSRIEIKKISRLTSLPLLRYLHKRNISFSVADLFCREVTYQLNDKLYPAIGFPNRSGGWELRSEYFKGSSAPKDSTFLQNGGHAVAVFEGFFNFLSFLQVHKHVSQPPLNFLVLNSLAFFEKGRSLMEAHSTIHLYLDRDRTGQDVTHNALGLSSKYRDESRLYEHYNDLNEYLTGMGKTLKQTKGKRMHW